MSDQLLIVLRVCLLALVYLVFLRVLRAVWVELRAEGAVAAPTAAAVPSRARTAAPAPAPAPAPSPVASATTTVGARPARLVVVAPPALAGHTYAVDGEITIGRGSGCAVSLDDAHVSKLHARVYARDGEWLIEDLGSTNGTTLDGVDLVVPSPIGAGGRIGVGEFVLEFT
ncbi:MAG: FHA domain-containing protein [Actinomycetota bacterium]